MGNFLVFERGRAKPHLSSGSVPGAKNSPEERCGFALLIGCERKCVKHLKNNLPECATCIKVMVLTCMMDM